MVGGWNRVRTLLRAVGENFSEEVIFEVRKE